MKSTDIKHYSRSVNRKEYAQITFYKQKDQLVVSGSGSERQVKCNDTNASSIRIYKEYAQNTFESSWGE